MITFFSGPASRVRCRMPRTAAATVLGLVAAPLALGLAVPADANPAGTGLVISEVYGGGGNSGATWKSDFIELWNPTAAAVDVDGWSVQWRSASGTTMSVTPLSGEVPAGGHYLVQEATGSGGTQALPPPDATGSITMGGTSGTAALVTTTAAQNPAPGTFAPDGVTVVDLVGVASNVWEGAGPATGMSNTASVRRTGGADTDNNAGDFTTATPPTPTNAAGQTTSPLAVSDPGDKPVVVGQPITAFDLVATGGTAPYTWSATGLPDGITVSPAGHVSGTPTAAGEFTVTVTATDSSPSPASDDEQFVLSVTEEAVITPIADIQGTGPDSPLVGQTVTTEGVVTAMYPTGGLNGMYVQTGGTGDATDETPGASDAVFVFGASSMPAGLALGDSVRVTGVVSEFNGTTEITPGAGGVTELATGLGAVTPLVAAYPTTTPDREAHEGELLAPTDRFTVTNAFNTNRFGEVGLATGDHPLVQPTEVVADDDAAGLAAVKADNAARAVTLDDGATIDFIPSQGDLVPPADRPTQDIPLPYLTPGNPIRVGATATLTQPVILNFAFGAWRFQPQRHLTAEGTPPATFTNTRPANAAPQEVGGDLQLATFNVLNFFNTTGEQFVLNGAGLNPKAACTYFYDRHDNRIANNACTPNGPRGAATQASLQRQLDKLVTAINALDADIVGLQEIESSIKLVGETNRDDAVAHLVNALNQAAGAGTWRYVHSPGEATTATNVGLQDVIRPAFIYKTATVTPVGQSDIFFEESANATPSTPAGVFSNAREPLAQAFKAKGALDSAAFAVVLNHFKSKGDSTPPATGDNANNPDTGAFNGDRVRQATKLREFADAFASARGIEAVFLAGDFNSYTREDPMQVLYEGGYTAIESDTEGEESYSFSGLSGSLDHVLGNAAAMAMVTGADIWDINASESVAFQYSRFNYNATQFFDAGDPFATSDHNPEVVGLDVPDVTTGHTDIQLLGTNDFHGRLLEDGQNSAGAAILAGAVDELRGDFPNTVFTAAGDLIGASTFESFIQNDEPTIEALNEAGLEVSAAGNHEFDQGYEDFVGRVQDHADWEYIAANVEEPAGRDDLAETWTKSFDLGGVDADPADDVTIGFVGAVTEDLPTLVSPAGIEGVTVTDIVDATNAAAADLRAGGADLVVLLVHEGSPSTSCATMTDPTTAWGAIVTGLDPTVDAVVSGHTHLAYNCEFPVQVWVDEGRAVTTRPVVSAGQYGTNLNQLVYTYDDATGALLARTEEIVGLAGTGFAPDAEVAATVAEAKAQADVLGAAVLGRIGGPFNRAKLANGTTENRGGESTLGNLVAEVQQWATASPERGAAQIAFMNPGGLRADMTGTAGELTYKQAAVVQPFANTLVNMRLTGAQLKQVLEQQWQRDATNKVPSRPFLRLGISEGFTYTYETETVTVTPTDGSPVQTNQKQGTVTGMWLHGEPVDLDASYSVTVNSFLASGGDNFPAFRSGAEKRDTGMVDLEAMVDFMAQYAETPLAVDYTQRSIGVQFPADAPATYGWGDTVEFALSSLAFSTAPDLKDSTVEVRLGDQVLGTFPVDNTIGTDVYDEYGTASVAVQLPPEAPGGVVELTVEGTTTHSTAVVPLQMPDPEPTEISAADEVMTYGVDGAVAVTVPDGVAGTVVLREGGTLVAETDVPGGTTDVVVPGTALPAGAHVLDVVFTPDTAQHGVGTTTATVLVERATPTVSASVAPTTLKVKKDRATVTAEVGAVGYTPTGFVTVWSDGVLLAGAELVDGRAEVRLPAFGTVGTKQVTVRYSGDDNTAGAEVAAGSVTVVRRTPR